MDIRTSNKELLKKLKAAYKLSQESKDKEATFMLDGKEVLPAYAKYLIEYLESKPYNK